MKNIIFVDIDDVLVMHKGNKKVLEYANEINSFDDYINAIEYYSDKFDLENVKYLKMLTEKNFYIVIHSSWVRYVDLDKFKKIFKLYGFHEEKIFDTTSYLISNKEKAIDDWLLKNKVKNYVIIDNDPITTHHMNNFILIDDTIGFGKKEYDLINEKYGDKL